jgi:hypothetical protein
MTHTVTWKDGTQDFDTEKEAKNVARSMAGIVLVNRKPSGSTTTFRDGRELDGEEATVANLEFRDHQKGAE